jgi:hypothetical protein
MKTATVVFAVAVAAALALALAGCGTSGTTTTGYSAVYRTSFVDGCHASGGPEATCGCILKKAEAHITQKQLEVGTKEMREGRPEPAVFRQWTEECAPKQLE